MRTFNILSGDHDEYLIVTPTKEEVVKDLGVKRKQPSVEDTIGERGARVLDPPARVPGLPLVPHSSASSGLPAENESVKPSLDEDPKPKRARESCVYCIGKCVCADIKPSEQHSFSDTEPCKLCDAPMCLK